jgi:hypothetical protein
MLDINYDFALYNSGFSNSKNGTQLPRHRWYQVKEAFSPELVKHAIKKANCRKTDLLFDPFCGSGTVPLVAAELDIHSITFEINPFLCFLAKTKLKNCSIQNLDLGANVIIPQIRGGAKSILENCSTFCRRPNLDKWLFNKPVLRGMEGGWVASENFDSNTKDIIRLCLIAAAMDCCNAKRDGKCLRYKKNWKNLNYGKRDFLKTFLTKMQVARSDIITSKLNQHSCRFFLDDSRNAANYDRLPDFKLCITSPPI